MLHGTMASVVLSTLFTATAFAQPARELPHGRLPENTVPVLGMWGWSADVLRDDGYRARIEQFRDHTDLNVLTVCCRVRGYEVVHPTVHDQLKRAVAFAKECGLGIAFELDVRLARGAFQKAYPDELQEMLRLRTVDLQENGEVKIRVAPETLRDHMNGGTEPYYPVSNRLVRVFSYAPGTNGIRADSVRDITDKYCSMRDVEDNAVEVSIACDAGMTGRRACVAVAFTLFTPDVFAPHLLEFQESIFHQYDDIDMAGAMKDEWGFPPCFDGCPEKNDFWYSEARAKAYADRTGGRDLVRDCLLMYLDEEGREQERQAAINHFRDMSRVRNTAIEDHYYRMAKQHYGPDAFVVTHPTWMPYPGTAEFKKNGLDWWTATRDLAQTDEGTPFCVRTALAKKWGSPVWINQYYSTEPEAYERNVWSHALGGGRINYHALYPYQGDRYGDLFRTEAMLADARIRLLNLIAKRPVDCPVAVVFGHACAMNWAGPAYDDVGLDLTDRLWREGFYADLIPSSEIAGGALRVNEDGTIQYGPQTYAAVVLYHPEFENPGTAVFFQKAASGKTALYRVGEWTRDFNARPLDGGAVLPAAMRTAPDADACAGLVLEELRARGVQPHNPATWQTDWNAALATAAPSQAGAIRLLDGTRIMLAGERNVAGDPVEASFAFGEHTVHMEAVGVTAARLGQDGQLDAFVAGGLKRLEAPGITLELPGTLDVAYWHEDGRARGIIQGTENQVPAELLELTKDWQYLSIPTVQP